MKLSNSHIEMVMIIVRIMKIMMIIIRIKNDYDWGNIRYLDLRWGCDGVGF